ncbi:deoxyhypusine synthase [candidate division WOR-3 bacterium]|nr:deoxyhypusine synthase [candidate division WOR-3 bacterium]
MKAPVWRRSQKCPRKTQYLSGARIFPDALTGKEKLADVIEKTFLAYNAARIREACGLFVTKMLGKNVFVGMSLAGALTPAGLGKSTIVPLINAGFVDWIVSTGANLYHDLHFAFNLNLHVGSHRVDDADLVKNDVVRIYDILFSYNDCLLETDRILRDILRNPEFQKEMGTAEFHYLLGKYAAREEKKNHLKNASVLAAAYHAKVPIYTSSPADSGLGMHLAENAIRGSKTRINPSTDINETAAIVFAAKNSGGKSGVLLIGGGSPKNFVLQTEPHIQEILYIPELGHDYFLQITDARPDTGGLSGATPHEAVSWGKIDPNHLPDAVVCYLDATVALPLLTHYALAKHKKRPLKKLYSRRNEFMELLKRKYWKRNR